jgi:glutamyl-tRNA reductase
MDDLATISESNRQEKEQEARRAEEIVGHETEQFLEWFRTLEVLPTVISLRRRAEEIRKKELHRMLKRLEHRLTPEEQESLDAMTQAIVKKLLHRPTVYLKEQRNLGQAHLFREIFNLENA